MRAGPDDEDKSVDPDLRANRLTIDEDLHCHLDEDLHCHLDEPGAPKYIIRHEKAPASIAVET